MSMPLSGIRVLDLSQGVAGPYCTLMLADLGADVIKVEPPRVGDIARGWGPPFVRPNVSAYFYSINRNKRSIVLDLKKESGKRALEELIRRSDVLVENFRPVVMKSLGFDREIVRGMNPRIVYCSITGYGQDGPSSNETAFDNIMQARSGLMSVTGADDQSYKLGVPITDLGSGMNAAFSVAVALYRRTNDGKGSDIDISMLDTAVSWLCYWVTGYSVEKKALPRTGNAHPTIAPYETFRTRDGVVALGVTSNRIWEKMVRSIGKEELLADPRFGNNSDRVRNRKILRETMEAILSTYDTESFVRLMADAGVPCASVQTIPEVINDIQVIHRQMIMSLDGVLAPGSPVRIDHSRRESNTSPPDLGVDTRDVLREIGWGDRDIAEILDEAGSPPRNDDILRPGK